MKKNTDMEETPYNPLDKRNIGESIIQALLRKRSEALPPSPFPGAGVYAIYYRGSFPLYQRLSGGERPIYVGKAVPLGARKGYVMDDLNQGPELYNRLRDHADSLDSVSDMDLADFCCRFLTVDSVWIPLAEALLIQRFRPVWNVCLDGFGNHDPGKGRRQQQKSAWDTLHPGRAWADCLNAHKLSKSELQKKVEVYLDTEWRI